MGVSPIADLIEEVQAAFVDQHGVELTQAALARLAGLSPQRMSQLLREPVSAMPSPETIEGLAKALRVSQGLVLQRFMESVGYDIPDEFPVAARKGTPKKLRGEDEQGV